MQDELIAIKGVKDGLLISLSPKENWQSVTDHLASRIDDRADFLPAPLSPWSSARVPCPSMNLAR